MSTMEARAEYPNPLIPGFNPDPSIVRVGADYYLVTSTFEYLPGIPVYHSTNLIDWTQIGNVATRHEQLGIESVPTAGGVWAPTIRFRDGVFYVIVTIAMGRGCVLFTATDAAGPWSDGTLLDGVGGIDPDLFWGDDGTAYVTYSGLSTSGPDAGAHHGIQQLRVDLETGRALEEPRSLWSGTGLKFPEAPHLYRRGGYWYLMIAEGGTERGHGVSIARSTSPEGPFEGFAGNPFLSARSTSRPIQNTGHGDLVETPDGGTAIVLLGTRPRGMTQAFSALGRETFITRVDWQDDWPVAEPVELRPRSGVTEYRIGFGKDAASAAGSPRLDEGWIAVRRLPLEVSSLDARPGWLNIVADGSTLDDARPAFLGRRQLNQTASVSTRIDASAGTGGLAVRYDENHHYSVEVSGDADGNHVLARARLSSLEQTWSAHLPAGEVTLWLDMARPAKRFFAPEVMASDHVSLRAEAGGTSVTLATLDGRYLSSEVAASFTGRVIGLYATAGTVAFEWFDYRGSED